MMPITHRKSRALPARRFRLQVGELESRELMAAPASGPMLVAALGDSFTDEYSFYGPGNVDSGEAARPEQPALTDLIGRTSARNWPLFLTAIRPTEVSFGPYSTVGQGEPRDQGFAQDWARAGVAAATFPNGYGINISYVNEVMGIGTSPGLLTQSVATTGTDPSDIGAVVILIGVNDYLFRMSDAIESDGAKDDFVAPAGSTQTPVNAAIESAVARSVEAIRAKSPNTKIVLVTTPDVTQLPLIGNTLTDNQALLPDLGAQMRASDEALSRDFKEYAFTNAVGLVDYNAIVDSVRQQPTVAGVTVDLAASGASPSDGYIGDGLHPGTVIQTLVGQAVVGAIDQISGSDVIQPISDAEVADYISNVTPTVTLTADAQSDTTLDATVTTGADATAVASGDVSFTQYIAATSTVSAHLGEVLGQVPLSPDGTAALTIDPSKLDGDPVVAVYDGNEAMTLQMSSPLLVARTIPSLPPAIIPTSPPTATPPATTTSTPPATTTSTPPATATSTPPAATPTNASPAATTSTPAVVASITPIVATSVPTVATLTPTVATSSVTLTPTYATSKHGQTITLTITVDGTGLVPDPRPAGTVTLLVGGRRLQFEAVVDGRAVGTFPLAKLRGRIVSATYTGDGILPTATAAPIRIAMKAPPHHGPIHQAGHPAKSAKQHR